MIEPRLSDAALSADIAARCAGPAQGFDLWWLGQSGFLLRWEQRLFLIDPYLSDSLTRKYAGTEKPHVRMSRRVIDPFRLPRVQCVLSTHNHTDHLDAETIGPILKTSPDAWIVVPAANVAFAADRLGLPGDRLTGAEEGAPLCIAGVEIHVVPAAHDRIDRDEGGRPRCIGYVLRLGEWTIYHSGDTVAYDGMAELLRPFHPDAAILPINGKVGNMDGPSAAELAKAIGARITIPCHFNLFEFNTASPIPFVNRARQIGAATRVLELGERFSSSSLGRIEYTVRNGFPMSDNDGGGCAPKEPRT